MIAALLQNKTTQYTITALVVVIVLVVLYRNFDKIVDAIKRRNTENKDGINIIVNPDTNTQIDLNSLARQFKNAINPSGISWMSWSDGTDEDALFDLAKKINANIFNKVSQVYRNLYNSNLMNDLQEELNSSDLSKFLQLAKMA